MNHIKIAIIPARGGSKRIPRKNIKPFLGKPIIAYSIETAKASGLFDRIIVSTEDDEIKKIASDYGAEIFNRQPELAEVNGMPDPGTTAVTGNALSNIQCNKHDYACCIYATSPLLQIKDLKYGYELIKGMLSGFAFSVGTEPLCDAGQFYWGRASSFMANEPVYSEKSIMIPIDSGRVCDINTEEDWAKAEQMHKALYDK